MLWPHSVVRVPAAQFFGRRQNLVRAIQAFYNHCENMRQLAGLFRLRCPEHGAQGRIELEKAVIKHHCGRFEDWLNQAEAALHESDLILRHMESPSLGKGGPSYSPWGLTLIC